MLNRRRNRSAVVTKIEEQKKRSSRFSVFIDGEFVFGVDRDVLLDHPLHEGDDITPEQVAFYKAEDAFMRAKGKALSLLSYRMRSVKELKERLTRKQCDAESIRRTVDYLLKIGLLDDKVFADAYVHTRMIQRPAARRVLERELMMKGVEPGIAADVLTEYYPWAKEEEIARDLAVRKWRQLKADSVKGSRRLADYLLRRGFSWDIIRPLVQEFESHVTQE